MYTGKWTSQILISQPKTDDGLHHCDQKALQQSHFIPDNESLTITVSYETMSIGQARAHME